MGFLGLLSPNAIDGSKSPTLIFSVDRRRTEREDNTAEGNEGNKRTKENLHSRTEKEIEGICEINRMAEDNSKQIVPPKYDLNAKWDACIDLTVRRFVYSSLGGAFAGLLFFRSPVTRWASVAFGAGLGIGSAYTDCSHFFDGSPSKLASPKISSDTPAPQVGLVIACIKERQ
ncbi:MICOS complex subunit [Citrus sinensis]|uniref:MICOS complex subunit n=1 Tax=Citrus sinensis TaxID=2711 RepID=A0ACB8KUD6_CITSI|nr:MICOS complex subunit [Citrus sinensis]